MAGHSFEKVKAEAIAELSTLVTDLAVKELKEPNDPQNELETDA